MMRLLGACLLTLFLSMSATHSNDFQPLTRDEPIVRMVLQEANTENLWGEDSRRWRGFRPCKRPQVAFFGERGYLPTLAVHGHESQAGFIYAAKYSGGQISCSTSSYGLQAVWPGSVVSQ